MRFAENVVRAGTCLETFALGLNKFIIINNILHLTL